MLKIYFVKMFMEQKRCPQGAAHRQRTECSYTVASSEEKTHFIAF